MRVRVALVLASAAALLLGCAAEPHAADPSAESREALSVRVETVEFAALEDRLAVVGTVRAQSEIVVAAKTLSYITSMPVDQGDRVRPGQTLAVLDDREFRAALDAAQASKQEAISAILAAEEGIAASRSQLHLAEVTHKRYSDLLAKQSVSRQEFDEVDARLTSANAGLALAQARKQQAEAKRTQAEAAVASARTALSYTTVTAPAAGLVTERLVDPGALAAPGAPLFRIEQGGSYRLEVAVPESQLPALKEGQVVPVEIDALANAGAVEGRVVVIVPLIDPTSRTFTTKIALPASPLIRSGQYGRAFLRSGVRDALTIAASTVVERGQLRFVFVVEDGSARRRAVKLGELREGRLEVLSGLVAGERVILDPADVADGDPVVALESA